MIGVDNSVSIIVPVYNNEQTIAELTTRLHASLADITENYEILLINDGSADSSWKEIMAATDRDQRCVGIRLSRNFGQHPAIRAGLQRARGSITVLMDADLQDQPEQLPVLLQPLFDDADIDIVYTHFLLSDGTKPRLTSQLFHALYARLSGVHLPANLGTYRAFRASVRDALLDYPERNAVYGPLMAQMGYSSVYVSVPRSEAVGRKTSYSFSKRFSLAVSALISHSSLIHRVVTWLGFTLTVLSGGYLVVLVLQYLFGSRNLKNGQLLTICIQLLSSGVLLLTVGLLTAYTLRIFGEVLARPSFHVSREAGTGLSNSQTQEHSHE